jgi:hypothetical protein
MGGRGDKPGADLGDDTVEETGAGPGDEAGVDAGDDTNQVTGLGADTAVECAGAGADIVTGVATGAATWNVGGGGGVELLPSSSQRPSV